MLICSIVHYAAIFIIVCIRSFCCCFFFFKQKTAYEMRISDWSSEVCSSDLWAWIEGNRRRVEQASGGRVAYVYMPNTADEGYTFFNRMYFAQTDKQALIVDERSNGGGQAANYVIDVLSRKWLAGWKDRDGLPWATPGGGIHGRSEEHTSELQATM